MPFMYCEKCYASTWHRNKKYNRTSEVNKCDVCGNKKHTQY